MPDPLPQLRTHLNAMHGVLLASHKALLDHERTRYEREKAPIRSPDEFLHLALHDPFFNWLRTISGLIVEIDEFLSSRKPVDPKAGEALLTQARTLFAPTENPNEFQSNYQRALQESPEVSLAHAQWKLTTLQATRTDNV